MAYPYDPLTAIAMAEGTAGRGDYDAVLGYGQYGQPPAPPSQMTVADVYNYGQNTLRPGSGGLNSSATGRYQIIGPTMMDAAKALGMDPNTTIYNQQTQDSMARWVMAHQGTGAWEGFKKHPDLRAQAGGAAVFDPTAQEQPTAAPATTGLAPGDLHSQWKDFLSNDDNRAALFQLGISLLQPMGVGQSVFGHIGQALGQAGEVYGTRDELRQKQELADQSSFYKQQELELQRAKLAQDAPETAARTEYYKRMPRDPSGLGGALTEYQKRQIQLRIGQDYDKRQADPLQDPLPITRDQYIQQELAKLGMGEAYVPGAAPTAPAQETELDPKLKDILLTPGTGKVAEYQRLKAAGLNADAEKLKQQVLDAAALHGPAVRKQVEDMFGGPPTAVVTPPGGPAVG